MFVRRMWHYPFQRDCRSQALDCVASSHQKSSFVVFLQSMTDVVLQALTSGQVAGRPWLPGTEKDDSFANVVSVPLLLQSPAGDTVERHVIRVSRSLVWQRNYSDLFVVLSCSVHCGAVAIRRQRTGGAQHADRDGVVHCCHAAADDGNRGADDGVGPQPCQVATGCAAERRSIQLLWCVCVLFFVCAQFHSMTDRGLICRALFQFAFQCGAPRHRCAQRPRAGRESSGLFFLCAPLNPTRSIACACIPTAASHTRLR